MRKPKFADRDAVVAFVRRRIPLRDREGLHLDRLPLDALWNLISQHGLGEKFWEEYQ